MLELAAVVVEHHVGAIICQGVGNEQGGGWQRFAPRASRKSDREGPGAWRTAAAPDGAGGAHAQEIAVPRDRAPRHIIMLSTGWSP